MEKHKKQREKAICLQSPAIFFVFHALLWPLFLFPGPIFAGFDPCFFDEGFGKIS